MGDKTYHFPLIWFQEEVAVRNLSIEHLHRREFVNPIDTVRIEKDAVVDGLIIRDMTVEDHTEGGCRGLVNYGIIRGLRVEGVAEELIRNHGIME
jgi:hypothetical protein